MNRLFLLSPRLALTVLKGASLRGAAAVLLGLAAASNAQAGLDDNRSATLQKPATDTERPIYQRGRWEFALESSYNFTVIPNPLFLVAGQVYKNPLNYELATQILSVRYQLTNPCGPWLLRGSLEASANIVGSLILQGPETYFIGFAPGFRYYFVQPGARVVPYIELRGGPGQTDSSGKHHAQQRDLAFTYIVNIGARYDVNRYWSATASFTDQHLSNAYLADQNFGFDSVGVNFGLARRF